MAKKEKYFFILSLIAVPIIIYFYFLPWKTTTIYGDDLFLFKGLSQAKNYLEAFRFSTSFAKFRPVHAISSQLVFELFQKNLNGYYLFNVFVHTINTYLIALLLNLFLKSPVSSVFFSLIYGLTRFSFFTFSQLFNGGALEGLAITFFLLSLFFVLQALVEKKLTSLQTQKAFLWSILFANLSMYTHERYIILFPFIILTILFFPGIKTITRKQKILLSIIPFASILLNVFIKKYIYSMPFFVGTGGTNISFSFSSAVSFFKDAVLSIFQINSGPEYLTGIQFTALKGFYLIFTLLVTCSILAIFTIYLLSIRKAFTLNQEDQKSKFFIFLFLIILFVFCLIPAISTIRLEQRWLMASFSIFVIMIVIALSGLQFKSVHTKNAILLSFVICFLYSDYNYFHKGIANLYMTDAQKTAATFKKAVNNHTIHPNTTKLYIWEKHLDINSNNALNWALGEGYLFNFYQNQSKEIFFADSIYHKQGDSVVSSFPNFNKDSTQILYVNDSITDITDQYLKDSLKSWKE